MVLAIVATIIYDQMSVRHSIIEPRESQMLDSLLQVINENTAIESHVPLSDNAETPTNELFAFNPNLASEDDFIKLGLKPYLAERILKYRSKGGKFKIKADLKKIYGFPEFLYVKLESYIDLPEIKTLETKTTYSKTKIENNGQLPKLKYEYKKQDLNLADSVAFEKVYGIGFKLALRIIKFREKLGGFVAMAQLKEIWGLDSTVIQEIEKKFLIAENFQPIKINANTDDFQLLKSHPYIGYQRAKLILAFRKQHGTYHSIDQLKQIQTISAEEIEKMKPYLEF